MPDDSGRGKTDIVESIKKKISFCQTMQIKKHAVLMMLCLGCSAASAWQGPMAAPSEVKDDCELYKVTCVRHWSEMSAKERADLWPYLDAKSRSLNWRTMTNKERNAMRELLPASEKEALRRRFALKHDDVAKVRAKHVNLKRLCTEDRMLMREQIREFHVERVGNRPNEHAQTAKADCVGVQ